MLPRRFVMPGVVLALALGLTVTTPSQTHADNDHWVPTDWTGVVAGAPVPGVGLPYAPIPPALPAGPYPVIDYEPQAACDPTPKPGALRLERIIKDTYGARQLTWIPRDCSIGPTSEHKEGRALDWMVSVRVAQQRADAEAFLNWLLGPDQSGRPYGNALQLGVMYIGWHDRIWRGFGVERGWQELKGCFGKTDSKYDNYCHRNHIHISLTPAGATGVTGADPSGQPVPSQTEAPPPPEAPLDDTALVEQREQAGQAEATGGIEASQVLVQPGSDADLFTAVGSQLGYRTTARSPIEPGKATTIQLAPIPDNATSALVSVTTRGVGSEATVQVGLFGKRGNAASLRVLESKARTSVLSVPVRDGSLRVRAESAPVQVRLDVLGYAIDDGVYPAVGSVATELSDSRFSAGQVVTVRARGVGPVPRKPSNVTAVILRVTAEGLGTAGRFAVYPLGGADLGTTSAVVPATGSKVSVVVADIGRGGQIAMTSSARSRVKVDIVGYVQR